jgi:hypothetical protein
VPCIGFLNPGRFALARRKGGGISIPRFRDEHKPVGKEDVEVRSEGAQRCELPRTQRMYIFVSVCVFLHDHFVELPVSLCMVSWCNSRQIQKCCTLEPINVCAPTLAADLREQCARAFGSDESNGVRRIDELDLVANCL